MCPQILLYRSKQDELLSRFKHEVCVYHDLRILIFYIVQIEFSGNRSSPYRTLALSITNSLELTSSGTVLTSNNSSPHLAETVSSSSAKRSDWHICDFVRVIHIIHILILQPFLSLLALVWSFDVRVNHYVKLFKLLQHRPFYRY